MRYRLAYSVALRLSLRLCWMRYCWGWTTAKPVASPPSQGYQSTPSHSSKTLSVRAHISQGAHLIFHPARTEGIMPYRVLIVLQKAEHNYAAYAPEVLSCVATGKTRQDALKNMQDALRLHFDGMAED